MRSKSLGRKFIELGKYDSILLASITVELRERIEDIIGVFDRRFLRYTDLFFAYEVLDNGLFTSNSTHPKPSSYDYRIVMAYTQHFQIIQHILDDLPHCALVDLQVMKVVQLYNLLANTNFRVENCFSFERLHVKDYQILAYAKNVLSRMINVEKDVLCMCGIEIQEKFLDSKKNYIKQFQKRRGLVAEYEYYQKREQRGIQIHLYGVYCNTLQVHLSPAERKSTNRLIELKEGEMSDCLVPQPQQGSFPHSSLISEQEEMVLRLMNEMELNIEESKFELRLPSLT